MAVACFVACILVLPCYHLRAHMTRQTAHQKKPQKKFSDPWAGLVTEAVNPRSRHLDQLSALDVARRIAAEDVIAVRIAAGAARDIAKVAADFCKTYLTGRRVLYVGAGTSGRLGVLDAAELAPTYGVPRRGPGSAIGRIAGGWPALRQSVEGAEDDRRSGRAAVADLGMGRGDLVIGVSASSLAPYVRAALFEAHRRGARTALVTMNRIARPNYVDHLVAAPVGPEVVAGSTRMKSGLATKSILHNISTTAMVLAGKVYGNRMVDLKTWCAKLQARGERLVMELGNVTRPQARKLLKATHGSAKPAIVMARCGVSYAMAGEMLASRNGRLRDVLEDRETLEEMLSPRRSRRTLRKI